MENAVTGQRLTNLSIEEIVRLCKALEDPQARLPYETAFRETPEKVIASARAGSLMDFDAIVQDTSLIPDRLVTKALSMFCSHIFEKPPKDNPADPGLPLLQAKILGIEALSGIANMDSHFKTKPSLGPTLIGIWPKLLKMIQVLRKEGKEDGSHNPLGLAGKSPNDAEYPSILKPQSQALESLMSFPRGSKAKIFFDERLPDVIAGDWPNASDSLSDGPFMSYLLARCIYKSDDPALFMTKFLKKKEWDDRTLVKWLADLADSLLCVGPSDHRNYPDLAKAIFPFVAFAFSTQNGPFSMWDTSVLNGAVPLFAKVFKVIGNQKFEDSVTPPDGVLCTLTHCLTFFTAAIEYKAGFPTLVALLNEEFLQSFVKCSPLFAQVTDGNGEQAFKRLISTQLPAYLTFSDVLRTTCTALEDLDIKVKRQKIARSCIEEGWHNFEMRILERLIYRRIDEKRNAEKNRTRVCILCYKHDNPEMPFKKCSGCQLALYCSKECQQKDWKQSHRESCKKLSTLHAEDKHALQRRNLAGVLAERDINRHLAGVRKSIRSKFPNVPLWRIGYVVDYREDPPVIDTFNIDDVKAGSIIQGIPVDASNLTILHRMFNSILPERRDFVGCVQIWFRQGSQAGGFYHKISIYDEPPWSPNEPLKLVRKQLKGPKQRELTARYDEIDQVIFYMGFKRADEWYESGKGSYTKLMGWIDDRASLVWCIKLMNEKKREAEAKGERVLIAL